MKTMQIRSLLLSALIGIAVAGCSDRGSETPNRQQGSGLSSASYFEVATPVKGSIFSLGEPIQVTISPKGNAPEVDSVEVFLDGEKYTTQTELSFTWDSEGAMVGRRIVRMVVYSGDKKEALRFSTTLKSDIVPETWGYQVVSRYPHDTKAFTQGLIFQDGFLYEGTGQVGQSVLRKLNHQSGEVLLQDDLDATMFGEGITRVGDDIIQITWKARTGIVYDYNTLEEKSRFTYSTEGWGLTYTGEELVMSDGSNKLHFLNADSYVLNRTIDVYDDQGPVKNLNELEMIDGHLYANVWMTDKIAKIEVETGRVLAYIDMTGLLPENERNGQEDVLNGIAYDADKKRVYLTGKNWPALFEVQWFKKS